MPSHTARTCPRCRPSVSPTCGWTYQRLERLFGESIGAPGRVELDLGGAQGMETALRIAFSAVGPGTVPVFEGAFHGRSGVTSMLSSSPRYRELLAAWGLEVVRLPVPIAAAVRMPRHR